MPFRRNSPAIVPANESATNARRSIFMGGSVPSRDKCAPADERLCHHAAMELRVVRHTDRFDTACRFWGELLGWPVTRQWAAEGGQGRGCIFGYGDTARVELIEVDRAVAVTGVRLGVQVDDVAAVHARVVAAGHTPTLELADQSWGHRSFAVVDPSGIDVTLFQVIADHV